MKYYNATVVIRDDVIKCIDDIFIDEPVMRKELFKEHTFWLTKEELWIIRRLYNEVYVTKNISEYTPKFFIYGMIILYLKYGKYVPLYDYPTPFDQKDNEIEFVTEFKISNQRKADILAYVFNIQFKTEMSL